MLLPEIATLDELLDAHAAKLGKDLTAYRNHTYRVVNLCAALGEHHKISAYRGNPQWLVEPFRRADWVDVTRGLRTFGLPRSLLREIFTAWPSAGFHKRLVQLELKRLRTHPWNPLPMVRL